MENWKQSLEHENAICSLAVIRDGTKIIGSDDYYGKINVWAVASRDEFDNEWTQPENFPALAIPPDDRLVAVGDETVFIYIMDGRLVIPLRSAPELRPRPSLPAATGSCVSLVHSF